MIIILLKIYIYFLWHIRTIFWNQSSETQVWLLHQGYSSSVYIILFTIDTVIEFTSHTLLWSPRNTLFQDDDHGEIKQKNNTEKCNANTIVYYIYCKSVVSLFSLSDELQWDGMMGEWCWEPKYRWRNNMQHWIQSSTTNCIQTQ